MTKYEFLELFKTNRSLKADAEKWWNEVKSSQNPCSKLWFKHWKLETRALPEIARAFAEAIRRSDVNDYLNRSGSRPDELFKILSRFSNSVNYCSANKVENGNSNEETVTFIQPAGDDGYISENDAIGLPDAYIYEAIKRHFNRRTINSRITWICPLSDFSDRIEEDALDINEIHKKLGLAHWRKGILTTVIIWQSSLSGEARIPTVLEGTNPFFKPAPPGCDWGKTMDIENSGPGYREAVVCGDRDITEKDEYPRWFPSEEFREEFRKVELCDRLLSI
ncbi:hypothetical protein HQ587_04425 [bacterium]|nr:hypothetical protein [bacterium]